MTAASATKSDKLNALYKECGLVPEDVHKHQHYTILTRTGIEKVQAHYKITVKYKALKLEPKYAVMKATARMGDAEVETYGSAVPDNCRASYFAEMAEKRALSRAVLKITGLYQHGFFGEDESDDFSKGKPVTPAALPMAPESHRLILQLLENPAITQAEADRVMAKLDGFDHEKAKATIDQLNKWIADRPLVDA